MLEIFKLSLFGEVIYYLSRGKYFRMNDEDENSQLSVQLLNREKKYSIDSALKTHLDYLTTISNDIIIVDWNGENDPENPRNWSMTAKFWVALEICMVTLSVNIGASIYTAGIVELMSDLGVSQVVGTIPLTLYVFGLGLGPMIFSPFSEQASIGRRNIYMPTLFVFMILQIPTALSKNIASLSILRFLGGLVASPCLSIGPATICDVLTIPYGAIGIGIWSVAAVSGPLFGPIFGAVLTVKGNWRWCFWFLCIFSGSCFFIMIFLFPETNGNAIMYKKAKRLRKKWGTNNIISNSEINSYNSTKKEILVETLWRPIAITFTEPVVLLIDIYLSLIYSLIYLYFESFPIVFMETKGFSTILMGVAYLSVFVGSIIGCIIYTTLAYRVHTRKLLQNEKVLPEVFLPMTIVASIILPCGVLIFGWTSLKNLPWVGPCIGAAIFAIGSFIIFQALFNYIGLSFPRYMASAFAGNSLFRSLIGGSFPLFGRIMYQNLATKKFPVAWGSSVLGFISLGMVAIPVLFYLNGPRLRANSKYSGSKEEEVAHGVV